MYQIRKFFFIFTTKEMLFMNVAIVNKSDEDEMKELIMDTLCDLSKRDIEKHFDKIAEIVKEPKFMCLRCARVANRKTYLCKPKKLKVV